MALGDALRAAVGAIDSALPVQDVTSMEGLVSDRMAERRFYMTLLTLFSALAIALAVTGVFGVMSYVVTHGRHEIAIRLALGARPAQVRAGVVRHPAK